MKALSPNSEALSLHRKQRRWCLGLGCAVLSGIQVLPSIALANKLPQLKQSRALMGTWVDIQVQHADMQLMQTAMQATWSKMTELATRLSRYDSSGELGQFSRPGRPSELKPSTMLYDVLLQAQQRHQSTAGLFDIRVGQLSGWDFRPGQQHRASPEDIARQLVVMRQSGFLLDRSRRTVRFSQHDVQLDLGGIAKLAILDAGYQLLRDAGLKNILLNGGGDVFVAGLNQGKPWRLAIRDPRQPTKFLQILELEQGVLASSGDYERCFDIGNQHYHHILDPRTGYPSQGIKGVSLLASDYRALNGLGSSLMVAGSNQAPTLLARHHGVAAIYASQQGEVWHSGNWPAAL